MSRAQDTDSDDNPDLVDDDDDDDEYEDDDDDREDDDNCNENDEELSLIIDYVVAFSEYQQAMQ